MKLTYRPDGQDEQAWEFTLGKFRVGEMKTIEKTTRLAFATEFKDQLFKGNSTARQALLWVLQRRDHPKLRLDDVDFADDELILEFSRAEWQEMHDGVANAPGLSDEERAVILGGIAVELANLDAETDPDGEPEDEGKAQPSEPATATG